jgi:hypothetical protein
LLTLLYSLLLNTITEFFLDGANNNIVYLANPIDLQLHIVCDIHYRRNLLPIIFPINSVNNTMDNGMVRIVGNTENKLNLQGPSITASVQQPGIQPTRFSLDTLTEATSYPVMTPTGAVSYPVITFTGAPSYPFMNPPMPPQPTQPIGAGLSSTMKRKSASSCVPTGPVVEG